MRRLQVVLTAAFVAIGLLVVPTSTAPSVAVPGPITWHRCGDARLATLQLQCASLRVPLDRADPTGAQVSLALSRRLHTTATRQGVMLVNPGGPGGSGLSLASIGGVVPTGAGNAYDWIGFDPRGVGASTPTLRCRSGQFGPDRPDYRPPTARVARYWIDKSRAYAAACASTAVKRSLLRHLTTLDTVLDMDDIRQALGVDSIGFYGFSYGSYLGQVYATRYPQRVGRFVLDGVVDPTRVWYSANLDQNRAFDRNIGVFFRYLAAHPRAFKLGRRWRTIEKGYYRELRRLRAHPSAGGRLGPDELTDAMLDAGYAVFDWVEIGRDYAALVHKNRGAALYARYVAGNGGDDNSYAMYNAVQCSDVPWPGYPRTVADARAVDRTSPFLTWSNTWFNAPCLFWQSPRSTRLAVSGASVSSRILLISETRDAATPYSGALRARGLFPTASLVGGAGGTTHASSLSGVACVDNTVATYLRTGAVPARLPGTRSDRACPRLVPPRPYVFGGRVTSRSGDAMPAVLRQALERAQRR